MTYLSVAAGGALGALLRFLLVSAAARSFSPGFPYGVFAANVLGSLAMGVLAAGLVAWGEAGHRAAPFLMTGVLGGFTTFSAFSLDAVRLAEDGRLDIAALYVGLSVAVSIAALIGGMVLAKALIVGGTS